MLSVSQLDLCYRKRCINIIIYNIFMATSVPSFVLLDIHILVNLRHGKSC